MAVDDRQHDELASLVRARRPVAALTGAGISVECGIPPFRGPGGLWERYPPEEHATAEALAEDPARAWTMLREVVAGCVRAEPGPGHRALARMEGLGLLAGVVTQNVDGLHQRAGSRTVIELHGSTTTLRCTSCPARHRAADVSLDAAPPRCPACGGVLRPDATLFNEDLPAGAFERAMRLVASAGALLVVGTSCQVYPAALLPGVAAATGAVVVEINPEPTPLTAVASLSLACPAGVALERLVSRIEGP